MTHQVVSFAKSGIRLLGVAWAVIFKDAVGGLIWLGVAELLGILEEIVDKRKE